MTALADSKTIEAQEARTAAGPRLPELPADAMILVPVRNFVMFTEVVLPLAIGRRRRRSARAAPSACSPSATPTPRSLVRSTCTAWAPSPMCCATSPGPTRPIT